MWPFASVCRYCIVHIYGGSIQLRGPLYSHISIYLNFEVYMEFITIYGNVFGYIQRALLLMRHIIQTPSATMAFSTSTCIMFIAILFLILLYSYLPALQKAVQPRTESVHVNESPGSICLKVGFHNSFEFSLTRCSFPTVFANGDVPSRNLTMGCGQSCPLHFVMRGSSSGRMRGTASSTVLTHW